MSSTTDFIPSGRVFANRIIRALQDTIREQASRLASMEDRIGTISREIEELLAQKIPVQYEASDVYVYSSNDYFWECPDAEEDPWGWYGWKYMHPWLSNLDEDEREWRYAEGTIKALKKKLTKATKDTKAWEIEATKAAGQKAKAEKRVAGLEAEIELWRTMGCLPDGHEDDLVGLAVFESWLC